LKIANESGDELTGCYAAIWPGGENYATPDVIARIPANGFVVVPWNQFVGPKHARFRPGGRPFENELVNCGGPTKAAKLFYPGD
jgi:hypothetical protein